MLLSCRKISTSSHWFCIMVGCILLYYICKYYIIHYIYHHVIIIEIKCIVNVMHLNHPETIFPTLLLVYDCLPWDWPLVPKILETADLQNYQVIQSKIPTPKELIARREKTWQRACVFLSVFLDIFLVMSFDSFAQFFLFFLVNIFTFAYGQFSIMVLASWHKENVGHTLCSESALPAL